MRYAKSLAVVLTGLALLVVWLLVARPDRAAEIGALKAQLAAEAELRRQAQGFAMNRYR